jgi:hypothetical protein
VRQQPREILYGTFVGTIVALLAFAAFIFGE